MKWLIKGVIVLLVTCLVLTVVGCGEKESVSPTPTPVPTATPKPEIKIGVIGPMSYIQGKHHLYGAEMARDEINAAGGVTVGNQSYNIKLVSIDSNEITSPSDAVAAMEKLITIENVDFVVGGFRSESVLAMQEKAMEYKTIFMGCGASEIQLCQRVAQDYNKYKYWFRVSPVNGTYLATISFMLTGMVAKTIGNLTYPEKPKIAILAENLQWADPLVAKAQQYFAAPLLMASA